MAELLKISELAARAGVEKSTVQHYIREGLLPPPTKRPHKNMAYYSPDLVDRIRLIKSLQRERYLPLAKIKVMLSDQEGITELHDFVHGQSPTPPEEPAVDVERSALMRETGISSADIDSLEKNGFVHPRSKGDTVVFRAGDAAVIRAICEMQAAGLNRENGFSIDDMKLYLDATRDLIGKEVARFTGVASTLPRKRVLVMARAGLEGTNRLLIALRRKVFLDLLGDLNPAPHGTSTDEPEES